jgi:hypothetical protein
MLAGEFVEAEIKEWLDDYRNGQPPFTLLEIDFLAMFAKQIIKSYEEYRQLVAFKTTTDSYGYKTDSTINEP